MINYVFLSLGFGISFLELLYGLSLYNLPSDIDRERGLSHVSNSIAGLIFMSITLGVITSETFFTIPSLTNAKDFYNKVSHNLLGYQVGIASVAARLQATMILSPLVGLWISMTWLLNLTTQTLIFIFYSFYILCIIIEWVFEFLVSLGIALQVNDRTRSISGSMIASPIVLRIFLSWLPKVDFIRILETKEFPIKIPFQEISEIISCLWNGQSGLLADGLEFIKIIVFISFCWSLVILTIYGLSKAFGGIAHVISSRL